MIPQLGGQSQDAGPDLAHAVASLTGGAATEDPPCGRTRAQGDAPGGRPPPCHSPAPPPGSHTPAQGACVFTRHFIQQTLT